MLVVSSTVRRTRTPDGAILLDVERGEMLCLNPVGSKILDLLDEECDESEIVDRVSETYGADVEVVRGDVRDFLETLSRHHIVRQDGPSPAGRPEATRGTRIPT